MYTEDEARKKWCPHVRYSSNRGDGINRWVTAEDEQPNPEMSRCIGSECMAWRWKPLSQTDENTIRGYARDTSREMAEARFQKTRQGYCGLSGSPYMGGE